MTLLIVCVVIVVGASLGTQSRSHQQVKVEVSYSGAWQGAYGDTGALTSWSGNGPYSITLTRPNDANYMWIISANAQKQDDSASTLTISIVNMDGTVIKTASTTTAYGIAQVSANIDG